MKFFTFKTKDKKLIEKIKKLKLKMSYREMILKTLDKINDSFMFQDENKKDDEIYFSIGLDDYHHQKLTSLAKKNKMTKTEFLSKYLKKVS